MKFYFKILWTSIVFFCVGHTQITAQTFSGLVKTKEKFILKHLAKESGDIALDSLLTINIQRIKNLPAIREVTGAILGGEMVFNISEKKTVLPIINFGGIENNFYMQVGATDYNFLGLGHQLLGYYQLNDKRNTFEIFYKIPFLKNPKWGLSGNILHWESTEPLFFSEGPVSFNYDNNALGGSVFHNLDYFRKLEFGSTFFREAYQKHPIQVIENAPGPDELTNNKYLGKLGFSTHKVNVFEYLLTGHTWSVYYQYVNNFSDKTKFNSVIFEYKRYKIFDNMGNLALRFRYGMSTNNASPFAPFVVDSHINIRGVGNRIDRGTAQLVFNIEYRYSLANKKEWAYQFVLFADNGNWRNPGGELNDLLDFTSLRQFVGIGLRILYKEFYDAIIRLDYGIDLHNLDQKGIVIGAGQYF